MKKLLLILPIVCTFFIVSCKLSEAIMKTSDNFKGEIDEFQAELLPLDTAARNIVIGLLDGVAADASKSNIDTLSKKIADGIANYLNPRIKELDTKSVGSNLMIGIKDQFNSPGFKDTLKLLINDAFSDLRTDLSLTIDSIFIDLSSGQNKARLESLMASFFTEANSVKMREFINDGIRGISFTSIADSLRMNLLNEETQAALNNVIPTKIDSILDKTEGILDKLGENSEGFIERNVWTIVASIASLMLLGTLLFLWRKKAQESKMNDVIMASISDIKNQTEYDALTGLIKRNAIQRGIESSLNKRLNDLGLLKENDNIKSK